MAGEIEHEQRIKQLINQVEAEAIDYAGRAGDVHSLEEWIAKGDHSQAEYKARQIITRQQQFRSAQENGLPAGLQQLVDQVKAEAIEYAGRAGDVRSLEEWIAKGDHSQAEYKAGQIITRQQQFRSAQENGLPAGLQRLVDQIKAEAIDYAGRAGDVHSLEEWIAKGDHSQAEYKAGQIIARQKNIRSSL